MISTASSPVLDSETATLFNPAFCAAMLHRATTGYQSKASSSMPITFGFLILPSALHKPTRAALPSTTAASLWSWLRANPILLMDFPDRIRGFRPYTSAAITYGIQHDVLHGVDGGLAAGTLRHRPRTLHPTADWLACMKAAEFLGKWLGGSDADEATTLARWGVRP